MDTAIETREAREGNGRLVTAEMPIQKAKVVAWSHSDTMVKFSESFVSAQCEIEGAVKDAKNPHFGKMYADLSSVMAACKPSLNKYGIAILQFPVPSDKGMLSLETILLHKSGEFLSSRLDMPLSKIDPQGYGSAMTYARRYALAAMTGVCPEDDDAELAMNGQQAKQTPAPPAKSKADPEKSYKAFTDALKLAFDGRTFTKPDRISAVAGMLARWNRKDLKELTSPERHKVIEFVVAGEADQYRAAIES